MGCGQKLRPGKYRQRGAAIKKPGMITIPGFLPFRCFMTSAFLLYKPVRYFPVRKTAAHTRGNGAYGGAAQSCVYNTGKEHTNIPDRE